jgi:SAM-dependent methyltransferase
MDREFDIDAIQDPTYRAKFVNLPDIIEDWLGPYGGIRGKDLLEFGCGEGALALGMALRKEARRVVGIEVLDVYKHCLPIAKKQLRLETLPENIELVKIEPGGPLAQLGQFDFVYTWSVVEHVAQYMIADALGTIRDALKPGGLFFLQISPLYYSAFGSHMQPWIPEPWAHLSMQHDLYKKAIYDAPPTSEEVRAAWGVYIPEGADKETERAALWETYTTLNRLTAPQLCRLVEDAGFEILRELRTQDADSVPPNLAEIYNTETLTTQQIVLLMRKK